MARTKIIATIGPSCDSPAMIKEMIQEGVSVFRFNTKHNSLAWHSERLNRVRKASRKLGIPVAVSVEIRGPELRVGTFEKGQIKLKKNEVVNFLDKEINDGKKNIVVDQLTAIKGLMPGNTIYMDDGYLETEVIEVLSQGKKVTAKVVEGGILKNNKGINFPMAALNSPSLVKRDLDFISMPSKKDIDFFSFSFVRNKKDVLKLRKIIRKEKLKAKIIAKIETKQALDNFEEILEEADAIMVARGDLGIEIPLEQVPFYQKMIIKRCREKSKPVIVATQMLESMIKKPRPTRAEVTDVANAVYDSADALMLSGESACGKFPLKSVKTMRRIIEFIEDKCECPPISFQFSNLSEVIAYSAYKMIVGNFEKKLLKEQKIKSFVVFTDRGVTAKFLSRLRPSIPILAISDNRQARDQLCLSYGVIPFYQKFPSGKITSTKYGLLCLKKKGVIKKGDQVIVTYGKQWGTPGQTNTIRVEKIG